jgi:hypothetical protein
MRWGVGDTPATRGQAIGMTLAVAVMFVLMWWFWGARVMCSVVLDAWWDEPAYKAAQGTFAERGAFFNARRTT